MLLTLLDDVAVTTPLAASVRVGAVATRQGVRVAPMAVRVAGRMGATASRGYAPAPVRCRAPGVPRVVVGGVGRGAVRVASRLGAVASRPSRAAWALRARVGGVAVRGLVAATALRARSGGVGVRGLRAAARLGARGGPVAVRLGTASRVRLTAPLVVRHAVRVPQAAARLAARGGPVLARGLRATVRLAAPAVTRHGVRALPAAARVAARPAPVVRYVGARARARLRADIPGGALAPARAEFRLAARLVVARLRGVPAAPVRVAARAPAIAGRPAAAPVRLAARGGPVLARGLRAGVRLAAVAGPSAVRGVRAAVRLAAPVVAVHRVRVPAARVRVLPGTEATIRPAAAAWRLGALPVARVVAHGVRAGVRLAAPVVAVHRVRLGAAPTRLVAAFAGGVVRPVAAACRLAALPVARVRARGLGAATALRAGFRGVGQRPAGAALGLEAALGVAGIRPATAAVRLRAMGVPFGERWAFQRNPQRPTPDRYPALRMFDGDHDLVTQDRHGMVVALEVGLEVWDTRPPGGDLRTRLGQRYGQVMAALALDPTLGGAVDVIREGVVVRTYPPTDGGAPVGVVTMFLTLEFTVDRADAIAAGRFQALAALEAALRRGVPPATVDPPLVDAILDALVAQLAAAMPDVVVGALGTATAALDGPPHDRVVVSDTLLEPDDEQGHGGQGYALRVHVGCGAARATTAALGDATARLADRVRAALEDDPTLGGLALELDEEAGDEDVPPVEFGGPTMAVGVVVSVRFGTELGDVTRPAFWQAAA